MTKVAEDYRSAPERSSYPLPSPEGSDFSRWWEQESPKTLAGLGPFPKRESSKHEPELESDILDLLGAGSDDDENEPTRLLTRSLLQLAPRSQPQPALPPEPLIPLEPELGLPSSDSRLKVALSPESDGAALGTQQPAPETRDVTPAGTALDPSKLDEFARRINHGSVLHRWMANSSPRAAAPSLLVTPKVERSEPLVRAHVTTPASAVLARSVEPLLAKLASDGLRLARSRTFAVTAGIAAVTLLLILLLPRFKGAQASTQQLAASPPQALAAAKPLVKTPELATATPPAAAPAFITLRAGSGAEGALVELIGDGHLRAIEALPARIPANRSETYRVQARRPGYRDFSAEFAFASGDSEKDVLIDLTPVKAAPPPQAAQAGPEQWLQTAVPTAAAPASPAPQGSSTGQTLVRVKANAKPVAPGSASLSVNSIPISTVIVDGRSQGLTPRVLQVAPGSHTVVFVHAELGRRLVSVAVESGTTAVAAVRF